MRTPLSILMLLFLLSSFTSAAKADGGYGIVFLIIEVEGLKSTTASCDESEPTTRKTNFEAWRSFEQKNQDFVAWYVPFLKAQTDPVFSNDYIQRFSREYPAKCTDIPARLSAVDKALTYEWPEIQRRINANPPR